MTDRREIEALAQRMSVATGNCPHIEHDADGYIAAVWHMGCRNSPLQFAEFARRYLAR